MHRFEALWHQLHSLNVLDPKELFAKLLHTLGAERHEHSRELVRSLFSPDRETVRAFAYVCFRRPTVRTDLRPSTS
jgi:hypothetical protein